MEIRAYRPEDEEMIVSVMTEAFENDPLYIAFVEDTVRRRRFLEKFLRFRLRFGAAKGDVFVTDDCKAVAVWIRPGEKMTPVDLLRFGGMSAMLRGCTGAERKRLMAFNNFADAELEKCVSGPFWHLSPICVAPETQGQGYGTALLTHGLDRVGSTPCYLETQSKKNLPLYQKCGFTLASEAAVPGMGLTTYGMLYQK